MIHRQITLNPIIEREVSILQKRDRSLPACMKKKFYRYSSGAEAYGMSVHRFQKLAIEAKAIYKVDKTILINSEIIDEYLQIKGLTPEELNDTIPASGRRTLNATDPAARLEELEALKEELTEIIKEERRLLCKQGTEA